VKEVRDLMATIVSFHAHPDDETTSTGGTLAKAADAGHRVVIVWATRGEHGEYPDGFLSDGEALWPHRVEEAARAASILGAARTEFLGYQDSGMMGTPENDAAESFWQANMDDAADRLAEILRREDADVLTVYDDHGGYGHPDHIQVHRVGMRAAELAGTPRVFQATFNRDLIAELMAESRAAGMTAPEGTDDVMPEFGTPEASITTAIDVRDVLDRKRAAMQAHASQIPPDSWFLQLPPELYERSFGTEWFIRVGDRPAGIEHDLFEGS
jgi:LmbE family N-acetylglucosaminyl deacetylase